MNYVNAYGEPISIGSRQSHIAKPKPKAAAKTVDDKKHMGWAVTGYSPEQLANAKTEHEKAQAGNDKLPDWDEAIYMNGHRPQKARSKPYTIPDSANQCAEMLKRAGWVRVQVEEVIR